MIKTVPVSIDGNEYVITMFDAITGNKILFQLIKYLRGGATLLNGLMGQENILDQDLAIGDMLEKIIENVEPEELNRFVVKLLKNTALNNKPMTEDVIKHHFAGNYIEMYKVLTEIIKANYLNEGMKSFFAQAQRLMPKAAKNQDQKVQAK